MTELTRRAVVGGLAGVAVGNAHAQAAWPSRTITIMHGFPAGGPSTWSLASSPVWPSRGLLVVKSVIVESKPGASGTTAAALVARAAAPDGYTLMVIPSGHATAAATFAKLPYRSIDDFTMISVASEYPYVMATNPASGIYSVAELISTARSRTEPLLYGTPGTGSGPHLAIELFALKTKIKAGACSLSRQCAGGHRTRRWPPRFYAGPACESDLTCSRWQTARARGFKCQTLFRSA